MRTIPTVQYMYMYISCLLFRPVLILQTFEGISCSWCGDGYHIGCFMERLKQEPCHMGPLRNVIIPPSWIIKLPKVESVRSTSMLHLIVHK